jgi:hypothetical protein
MHSVAISHLVLALLFLTFVAILGDASTGGSNSREEEPAIRVSDNVKLAKYQSYSRLIVISVISLIAIGK